MLHMYDLSHGLAAQMSQALLGRHVEAVWHTAVVVFGREWYFGAGVQSAAPGRTHFGPPHRTLQLGSTRVERAVFDEFLRGIQPRFTIASYNIVQNNCNNFSNELATFLVGSGIPQDILDLPRIALASPLGPMLAPMLQPMSAALRVSETELEAAAPPALAPQAPPPALSSPAISPPALAPQAPPPALSSPAISPPAVAPQGPPPDASDGEAAFEDEVRKEFAALTASGMAADEAADAAVTRVLARAGLS